jgi:hypothetical protein
MPESRDTFERTGGMVQPPATPPDRPWLGVRFTCAGAYVRVYRSADGSCYRALCPKCSRCVKFEVGHGGTDQRFFEVSC